jgi:hypothetical protein
MNKELTSLQKNSSYFILGGIMLVLLNYLAINVNSTAAALIWSFPILSLPAYLFIYNETKRRDLILNMNSDIIVFFFVNLTFFLLLYCLLEHTQISVYRSMVIAFVIFFVIALATYYILRSLYH